MSNPRQQQRDLVRQREQGQRQRTPSPPRSEGIAQAQAQAQPRTQETAQGQLPRLPDKSQKPAEEAGPNKLSSNNWNSFVTSPYSPLTATTGGGGIDIQVNSIRAFSVDTIEVLSNLNIATGSSFKINGQIINPNRIISDGATATILGGTTRTFIVDYGAGTIFEVANTSATFQNAASIIPNSYILNVFGTTRTYKLSVGNPPPSVPTGYVASFAGDVIVNGTVTSSGTFDISGLQVNTLGVKQLLDVSGQSVLNGLVTARNGINVTGNSYVLGNLGVGKTNPTVALDIAGSENISQNLTVNGNATINGILGISGGLDISGSTTFYSTTNISSLYVKNNEDISGNLNLIGTVNSPTSMIGGTMRIGIPYSSYTSPTNATHDALFAYGRGFFNDSITVGSTAPANNVGSIYVSARTGATANANPSYITPYLVIGANVFAGGSTVPYNLEVNGTTHITQDVTMDSNATVSGTLNSRVQVLSYLWSAFPGLSTQPTTYIINCANGSRTINLTTQNLGSSIVGMTYNFVVSSSPNPTTGSLALTYVSDTAGNNNATTASVPSPRFITLLCTSWDGANNKYSASA
jgi:hypothetical protein